MKIALISDLHIGDIARAADLQVNSDAPNDDDNFQLKFKEFVDSNNINAKYLLITGDITNKADYPEFRLASEVIMNLANSLNVKLENICFVPGNHDKNWGLCSSSVNASEEEQRIAPYRPLFDGEDNIFKGIVERGQGSFTESPFICVWEYDDLIIYSYNSAIYDGPGSTLHYGEIRSDTINELDRLLKINSNNDKIKIFMTHHHPYQYEEPVTFYEPEFSTMQNSAALLEMLWKFDFDFLIHGHKHFPKFEIISNEIERPLVSICAGTFSATLSSRWNNIINNQFHLIEISEKNSITKTCKGNLSSWQYLYCHGWRESSDTAGIAHKLSFGNYSNYHELAESIKQTIIKEFKSVDFIKWSEFKQKYEEFNYLPPKKLLSILNKLEKECGYEISNQPHDLILLRAEV